MRYIHLGQPEMSSVAEHTFETRHSIKFSSTSILDKATGYMDLVIKEATDIRLHPINFNRDGDFALIRPLYSVMNVLTQYRDTPIWKQGQAKHA
jgi:hypothetical protein